MSFKPIGRGSHPILKRAAGWLSQLGELVLHSLGAVAVRYLVASTGLVVAAGLETGLGGLQLVTAIVVAKIAWDLTSSRRATPRIRGEKNKLRVRPLGIKEVRSFTKQRTTWTLAALSGVQIVMNLTYIVAVSTVTVGMYVTLEQVGMLMSLALAACWADKAPRVLAFPLIALAGAAVYNQIWSAGGTWLGILFGLVTGMGMAVRLLLTRGIAPRKRNAVRQWSSLIAGAALLIYAASQGGFADIRWDGSLVLLALASGLINTGLPQAASEGARLCGLSETEMGMAFCLSPAIGTVVGHVLLHQAVDVEVQLPALAVIVAAILGEAMYGTSENANKTRLAWATFRSRLMEWILRWMERRQRLLELRHKVQLAQVAECKARVAGDRALKEAKLRAAEIKANAKEETDKVLDDAKKLVGEMTVQAVDDAGHVVASAVEMNRMMRTAQDEQLDKAKRELAKERNKKATRGRRPRVGR